MRKPDRRNNMSGQGGQRDRIARAMIAARADTSPVEQRTQGLARLANALAAAPRPSLSSVHHQGGQTALAT